MLAILKLNISSLETIDGRIDKITGIIVVYSLGLMLFLVFFQVMIRDLFRISIYGIDELARYLLVCFSFFSGSIALRRNELVGVTFAVDSLPTKVRRWIDLMGILLVIIFLIVGSYYGFKVAVFLLESGQLSPSLQIPIGIAYFPVPLGFLLMMFTSIISAYDLIFRCSLKRHIKYKKLIDHKQE